MGKKEGDLFARVPLEWIPELDARAQAEGLNRSDIIRRALRALLSSPEPATPPLTLEEEGFLRMWRTLRVDAPALADALLRVSQAVLDSLPGTPGEQRRVSLPGEDAGSAGRGDG